METLQLSSPVYYLSLSVDEELLVVSSIGLTYVYMGINENNLTLAQTLEGGTHHRISSDNKYLLTASNKIKVYRYCTFESGYYLAGTDCLFCANGSYIS